MQNPDKVSNKLKLDNQGLEDPQDSIDKIGQTDLVETAYGDQQDEILKHFIGSEIIRNLKPKIPISEQKK